MIRPGSVYHLISRYVDRRFLLTGDAERERYLEHVAPVLRHTDAQILAYALMSSHEHWLVVAGLAPLKSFLQPLHVRFAQSINRRIGGLGPVFAGRFSSFEVAPSRVPRALAYLHNNPVRAGLVEDAVRSRWTSHQAYLGMAPSPPWLRFDLGLAFLELADTPEDRNTFAAFVNEHREDGRDAWITPADVRRVRKRVRAALGAEVELIPKLAAGGACYGLAANPASIMRPRGYRDPRAVLREVSQVSGIACETIQGRSRERSVVAARRLAFRVWATLGRPRREMAAVIGLTQAGASKLARSGPPVNETLVAAVIDATADEETCDLVFES